MHKNVKHSEIKGRIINPKNENEESINDGNETIKLNVTKVRITACTIPNVCCMA